MDTSKLITVTVWATLAFVAYELLKQFYGTSSSTSTSSSNAQVLTNLENAFSSNLLQNQMLGENLLTGSQLTGADGSPNFGGSTADNALDVGNGVGSNAAGYANGD